MAVVVGGSFNLFMDANESQGMRWGRKDERSLTILRHHHQQPATEVPLMSRRPESVEQEIPVHCLQYAPRCLFLTRLAYSHQQTVLIGNIHRTNGDTEVASQLHPRPSDVERTNELSPEKSLAFFVCKIESANNDYEDTDSPDFNGRASRVAMAIGAHLFFCW